MKIALVGGHVQHIVVERRCGPDPVGHADRQVSAPYNRIIGFGRIKLDELPQLDGSAKPSFNLYSHIGKSFVIDHHRCIDVVAGPEPQHSRRFDPLLQSSNIPCLDQSTAVPEPQRVTDDGDRCLDGHIGVAEVPQQFVVPARCVEDQLWGHSDHSSSVVTPVEFDDVQVRILAAHKQVVVNDDPGAIPVVIPQCWLHRVCAQFPKLPGRGTIERDDAEEAVARAEIHQRKLVGVNRDRTLDQVTHPEVGDDPFPGRCVQEMHRWRIGTEHDPSALVVVKNRWLASPAGATPFCRLGADRAERTQLLAGPEPPLNLWRLRHRTHAVITPRWVTPKGQQPACGTHILANRCRINPPLERRSRRRNSRWLDGG